jgi:hypothetical protein
MKTLLVIVICGLVALLAGGFFWLRQPASAAARVSGPSRERELTPSEVFARVSPSVVRVVVLDEDQATTGMGSGFVVSIHGLSGTFVVTNYHVIRDGHFLDVISADNQKLIVDQRVAASDAKSDLAVLKVMAVGKEPEALTLAGGAPPEIGTKVFAIGNPSGLTNTLSEGLISGFRDDSLSVPALQTTAPISPGSSGGPLLNSRGEVVGVTTAFLKGGQGLNFAIPAREVTDLLKLDRGAFQRSGWDGAAMWQARGNDLLARGNWHKAIEAFKTAAQRDPFDPVSFVRAGDAYEKVHDHVSALRFYRWSVKLRPDCWEGWRGASGAHYELKQPARAIEAAKRMVALQPNRAASHYWLGLLYHVAGERSNAARAYQAAYAVDPLGPDGLSAKDALNDLLKGL